MLIKIKLLQFIVWYNPILPAVLIFTYRASDGDQTDFMLTRSSTANLIITANLIECLQQSVKKLLSSKSACLQFCVLFELFFVSGD